MISDSLSNVLDDAISDAINVPSEFNLESVAKAMASIPSDGILQVINAYVRVRYLILCLSLHCYTLHALYEWNSMSCSVKQI
jgi:hypothetical protein